MRGAEPGTRVRVHCPLGAATRNETRANVDVGAFLLQAGSMTNSALRCHRLLFIAWLCLAVGQATSAAEGCGPFSPCELQASLPPGGVGGVDLSIINTTDSAISYVIATAGGGQCTTDAPPWLPGLPVWGTAPAGFATQITLSLDAGGLEEGSYFAELCAEADGVVHPVPIRLDVVNALPPITGCGLFQPCEYFEALKPGQATTLAVGLTNSTEAVVAFVLTAHPNDDCSGAAPNWIDGTPRQGSVPAGADIEVELVLDSSGLDPGVLAAFLCLDVADQRNIASVSLLVESDVIWQDGFEGQQPGN
jgi:hypothetical protein